MAPGITKKSIIQAQAILDVLRHRRKPVSLHALIKEPALAGQSAKTVKQELARLLQNGLITRRGKKYMAVQEPGTMEARLEITTKGFGFAILDDPKAKDIFIARQNLGGASHGDRVRIRIIGNRRGRPEARVVRILKRGVTRLAGIYVADKRGGHVIPDNEKLPYQVRIDKKQSMGAKDSSAVLVEILDYGTPDRQPKGKVIEILGDPDTVDTQIRLVIIAHDLETSFPDAVKEQTEQLIPLTTCDAGRKDLRHLAHVTIDGETAKDFDDAIFVEETANGFRLLVSIADVGHYVQPGSPLDQEAYRRGTSVYMPGRVIPMLPERLSNDLCSLVPNQDRPAFTAFLDFDHRGVRTAMRFSKSMIRSRTRFTYGQVREILVDKNPEQRRRFKKSLPMLQAADRLTTLLHARRMERGSLGFVIPQADIRLDEQGNILDIGHQERNPAHMLIEECMLAANEAVAEFLATHHRDVLYRIHEEPDAEKVEDFTKAAAAMGLQLPEPFEITPAWFARILEQAASSQSAYVINNLLLRTMQRARYSPQNLGHFGLAAKYYTHFTSPIRRYPDLIVHRALLRQLQAAEKTKIRTRSSGGKDKKKTLQEAAVHLSARERVAVDVERDIHARLAVLFMKDKVDEQFEAIISGVTPFALFLELVNHFVGGAVPVHEMDDDYYIHDPDSHKLVGELHGHVYQLGNIVQVRLVRVDAIKKQLTFALIS